MSTAQTYARGIAKDVRDAERGIVEGEKLTVAEAVQEFVGGCLDLEVITRESTAGRGWKSIDRVRLIRTVGGPHCVVELGGDGEAEVFVKWGRDTARVHVTAEALADYAFELAEMSRS